MKEKIGLYLKYYREQHCISQEYFSHYIGITTRHYQKIESGLISATVETLEKIVDAIGISFSKFFQLVELHYALQIA